MRATAIPTDGAEAWCRECTEPATVIVNTTRGREYLCDACGETLVWKLNSNGWNPTEPKRPLARRIAALATPAVEDKRPAWLRNLSPKDMTGGLA